MIDNLNLRLERKADWDTVERVTYRAFLNADHASGNEALLAHKLRSSPAFVKALDFVAEQNGRIVGNIMYSRVTISGASDHEALTFGPLSVLPAFQRQGVGTALVNHSLACARKLAYKALLIFGHETYYPRFGFKPASNYGITAPDGTNSPAFMALSLQEHGLDAMSGRLQLAPVFANLDKAEAEALNARLAEPLDIDEYIAAQAPEYRPLLESIRALIQDTAPAASEKISYQMPTFWQGENLIHFALFKRHLGIFPGGAATEHFAERLKQYKTSKGTIQFPLDKPPDFELLRDIVKWRVQTLK